MKTHPESPALGLLQARTRRHLAKLPTAASPLFVSASELRDFLRCRVKHHWRYRAKLVPRKTPTPLAFGSLIHATLEAWYRLPVAKRSVKAMDASFLTLRKSKEAAALEIEELELAAVMCRGYADWARTEDAAIGLGKTTPEQWFDLPLIKDGSIRVRGKIDLVFAPKGPANGTIACKEFKTKSRIDIDVIDLNLQLSVYLWALRQLFPHFKQYRAHYTVLRKQAPGPRVTNALFHGEEVERSDAEIDLWASDTQALAYDMLGAAVYPNPQDACAWDCDYRTPCLLRANARDLQDVFARDYMPKPPREDHASATR